MQLTILSDIHFGHKKTSGEHMYNNLVTYVYPEIIKSRMLIIPGDVFHSLLDFNHPASQYIVRFFNDMFYMSIKHGFGIRILRGTFSHDRNQVSFIAQGAHKFMDEHPVDIKTYSNISIDEECFDGETLKILYLPDDLPYKSQETVLDVCRELMASRKWDKVDMVVGHGYFSHVLPYGVKGPAVTYTVDQLSSICKHLVVFGHVHTSSIKKSNNITVIYVGSFERMNHGEEEPKGFITVDTKTWKSTFIENKNALNFLTYAPKSTGDIPIDEIIDSFKRWVDRQSLSTEQMNHIRVVHKDADIRQLLGHVLKESYPQYPCTYTTKSIVKNDEIVNIQELSEQENQLVVPTEENITDILFNYISDNKIGTLSKTDIQKIWNLNFE